MSRDEVKQAWITVGDELSALGLKLKYHFEEEMSESQAEEAKNALKKMADALEDSVESIANAVTPMDAASTAVNPNEPGCRLVRRLIDHRVRETIGETTAGPDQPNRRRASFPRQHFGEQGIS